MHVAAEVGFWTHPHTMRLARELREPLAGAYVLRLREFFLLHGRKGSVRATGEDIAAAIGFPGPTTKLIKALTGVRVLGRRKGSFIYLGWHDTPTGQWVRELDNDAAAARERRARRRDELAAGGSGAGGTEDSVGRRRGDVGATSGDIGTTSGQKEGRKEDASPAPQPPPGGGSSPAVPWETFRDAYPRERWRNLDATARRWERLTPDEQRAVMEALPAALLGMSRKKRAEWARIDRFVADRGWERFTPDQIASKAPRAAAPPKVPEKTPEQLEQERRLDDIARRRSVRFEEIKRELRGRGVRDKIDLLTKATDRLQREWPEGEAEPLPAGPFLVTVADGVTVQ